jgi:hypothetical protein
MTAHLLVECFLLLEDPDKARRKHEMQEDVKGILQNSSYQLLVCSRQYSINSRN